MLVNTLRDREGDRRAGRRTLAILLGRQGSIRAFGGLLGGVAAGILAIAASGGAWTGAAFGLAALPFGVRIWRSLRSADEAAVMNACLARTGAFQLLLTLAIAGGLILTASMAA